MIETMLGTLSAEDIAAMRMSEDVSLHVYKGKGTLRLHLRGGYRDRSPRVYKAREQLLFPHAAEVSKDYHANDRSRDIDCDWTITAYRSAALSARTYTSHEGTYANDTPEQLTCFSMLHSARYDHCWLTVAEIARAGDRLELRFIANNNSDNMRDANFTRDEARLQLHRERKAKYPLTFKVEDYVGPDNSARIVRLNG